MLWKALKQRKNIINVQKKDNNNMKVDENNEMIRMMRFLIKINIPGSSGPLRFFVNHNDCVSQVIHSALKLYAHQQRLPLLGSDPNCFLLYSSNLDFQAMNPWEKIGWYYRTRSFMLLRKKEDDDEKKKKMMNMVSTQNQRRGHNLTNWKALFTTKPKSFLLAF